MRKDTDLCIHISTDIDLKFTDLPKKMKQEIIDMLKKVATTEKHLPKFRIDVEELPDES